MIGDLEHAWKIITQIFLRGGNPYKALQFILTDSHNKNLVLAELKAAERKATLSPLTSQYTQYRRRLRTISYSQVTGVKSCQLIGFISDRDIRIFLWAHMVTISLLFSSPQIWNNCSREGTYLWDCRLLFVTDLIMRWYLLLSLHLL